MVWSEKFAAQEADFSFSKLQGQQNDTLARFALDVFLSQKIQAITQLLTDFLLPGKLFYLLVWRYKLSLHDFKASSLLSLPN